MNASDGVIQQTTCAEAAKVGANLRQLKERNARLGLGAKYVDESSMPACNP